LVASHKDGLQPLLFVSFEHLERFPSKHNSSVSPSTMFPSTAFICLDELRETFNRACKEAKVQNFTFPGLHHWLKQKTSLHLTGEKADIFDETLWSFGLR
jgi:hypothetical protein